MAAMYLEEELNRVRAGRANVAILSGVRVESYGQKVPLNQVANISTPDARTIAIKPWDKKQIRDTRLSAWASPSLLRSVVVTW